MVRPVTNIIEESNRPQTFEAVAAQWAQNLGGGLGAAAVWFVASLAIHAALYQLGIFLVPYQFGFSLAPWPDMARVGLASCGAGLLAFGLLMFLRSSLDEIVEAGEWKELNDDYDALELTLAETTAEWTDKYQLLRQEFSTLQADYNLLLARKGAVPGADKDRYVAPANVKPIPSTFVSANRPAALDDAIVLLQRGYHGHPWSRDEMMGRHKWTKGQWGAAKQWLVDAGVLLYTGDKGNVPKWVYPRDMDVALRMIEARQGDGHKAMDSGYVE
jgi:hypothetical protein